MSENRILPMKFSSVMYDNTFFLESKISKEDCVSILDIETKCTMCTVSVSVQNNKVSPLSSSAEWLFGGLSSHVTFRLLRRKGMFEVWLCKILTKNFDHQWRRQALRHMARGHRKWQEIGLHPCNMSPNTLKLGVNRGHLLHLLH